MKGSVHAATSRTRRETRLDARKELHSACRLSLGMFALGFAMPAFPEIAVPVGDDTTNPGMATPARPGAPAYDFDSRLLLGSPLGVADIERYNKASVVDPGRYQVDIYLNGNFIARKAVEFRAAQDGAVYPCLSDVFLRESGVLVSGIKSGDDTVNAAPAEAPLPDSQSGMAADQAGGTATPGECLPVAKRIEGASAAFDLPRLRLDINVPQALMKSTPRGSVDIKSLDAGETMAYVNYDTNYFTWSAQGYKTNSLYAGMNAGVNFGLWRLHQQSAYSYSNGGNFRYSRWNNIRAYAERPLPGIGSNLVVGQNFTSGNLLSSVGYTGVHLETDERALPDSMQGYAPIVTGIANTNARVVISQNGNTIYQTTVAPGPFRITDLNPTSFQGDLTVQVFEANGQVSTFVVPFSAVPNSRRAGSSHYSVTLGKVRQIEGASATFADLTYERGLTNRLTLNSATRLSSDYQALLGGGGVRHPRRRIRRERVVVERARRDRSTHQRLARLRHLRPYDRGDPDHLRARRLPLFDARLSRIRRCARRARRLPERPELVFEHVPATQPVHGQHQPEPRQLRLAVDVAQREQLLRGQVARYAATGQLATISGR